MATSRISEVEVASALTRRAREGAFSTQERDRGIRALSRDLGAWIVVELTAELAADARTLLIRYALRSGDAIQLASCLYIQREMSQRIPFAGFDDRLNEAARDQGLAVVAFP
jgi:predicted nucleic acid-binding protein